MYKMSVRQSRYRDSAVKQITVSILLLGSCLWLNLAVAADNVSEMINDESTKTTEAPHDDMEVITVNPTGLISYVSASASKSDIPIIETPSSVSVITEQRMADLGSTTVQDALGYVSGLYNGTYGYDSRGDWSSIRGVAPTQYLDGMKMLFGYYNNTRPSPFTLSQIEVLKGPTSVLYGQGSTGGIVNLVSKLPEEETSGSITASMSNNDGYQLSGDATGALTDDGSVLYRVIGLARKSGTQVDYVDDNSYLFSPSLTFNINDDTKLTLLANLQQNETGSTTQFYPHEGTVVSVDDSVSPNYGKFSSSTFISEPEFDRYDTQSQALTAMLDHDLNDNWSVRGAMRYMNSSAQYDTMYANYLDVDNETLHRTAYSSDATSKTWTSDFRLNGDIDTGLIEHNLVFGLDYQDSTYTNVYSYGDGGTINVYNPNYSAFNASTDIDWWYENVASENKFKQSGVYVQDVMKIADKFIVSSALRYDYLQQTNLDTGWQAQDAVSKSAGLMYLMDEGISPYINYSESFEVVNLSDVGNNLLDPVTGKQIEVGVKYQPRGTDHLITASAYRITQNNRVTTSYDSDSGWSYDQIGKVLIKGFELEAQLAWDEIDVYASYAYTDSEVLEGADDEVGRPLESTPDNLLSAWVTYRPMQFDGFKVGLGARFVGNSYFWLQTRDTDAMAASGTDDVIYNDAEYTKTGNYVVADLMVGYEFADYDVSLHVNNLEDKQIVTTCTNSGSCYYNQGRSIIASVSYKF